MKSRLHNLDRFYLLMHARDGERTLEHKGGVSMRMRRHGLNKPAGCPGYQLFLSAKKTIVHHQKKEYKIESQTWEGFFLEWRKKRKRA